MVTYDGDLDEAVAGQSVTLTLADEIDISRGDVLAAAEDAPGVADQFEAHLVWMSEQEMLPGRPYLLKLGSRTAGATVSQLKYKVNVNTLEHTAANSLELNEIGVGNVSLDRPIPFDPYEAHRETGGFVLVDRLSNHTVGAGLLHFALRRSENVHWQTMEIDRDARAALNGQQPCVVWFTGLSGAGKSTIANHVEQRLHAFGRHTYLLDGDNVRHGLSKNLGFSDADRVENIRRVAEVAALMADAGLIVLVSLISPFEAERQMARELIGERPVLRGVRGHAAGHRRGAGREGPLRQGPAGRADQLHRGRLALRGARGSPTSGSTPPRSRWVRPPTRWSSTSGSRGPSSRSAAGMEAQPASGGSLTTPVR